MIEIDRLDHLVLTVASIAFYTAALGMTEDTFEDGRKALRFGGQKINLHPRGSDLEPKALRPMPGSGDLCFVAATPLDRVIEHLRAAGVAIEVGPVERTGAVGPMRSVYVRDPDGNLIEISNPA